MASMTRGSARLNGMTGSTSLSSSGCGEMAAKKCRLMEATGSNRGSARTSSSNFSLVARIDMRGGWILRPVAGIDGIDVPVEDDRADHVIRGSREYLADRAYRDLGDDGV